MLIRLNPVSQYLYRPLNKTSLKSLGLIAAVISGRGDEMYSSKDSFESIFAANRVTDMIDKNRGYKKISRCTEISWHRPPRLPLFS